jgi:hypothetical protein
MPMQRSLYPKDWETLALQIKTDADWHCEGCGRPCRRPGEALHDLEYRLYEHPEACKMVDSEFGEIPVFCPGRFVLHVAHLDHQPANCHPSNLRAWCAPCHGRYDLNAIRSGAKARAALERAGQLSLLDLLGGGN